MAQSPAPSDAALAKLLSVELRECGTVEEAQQRVAALWPLVLQARDPCVAMLDKCLQLLKSLNAASHLFGVKAPDVQHLQAEMSSCFSDMAATLPLMPAGDARSRALQLGAATAAVGLLVATAALRARQLKKSAAHEPVASNA